MSAQAATLFDATGGMPKPLEFRFPHLIQRPQAAVHVAAQPGAQAFTYGWDTAFAIRLPDVNAAIVKAGSSPKSFAEEAPDKSCAISGDFGSWQVCRGGDGVLIHFAIPITSGCMTFKGQSIPVTGASVTIEVQLRHIPPQLRVSGAPPSAHNLMVQTTSAGPSEPVVSVVDLQLPTDPGFLQKALISGLLTAWFNSHLAAFTHVFNTVTINRIVDKAQFRWLAPTHTSYAYANGPTDETSILGVLCMTQNRSNVGIASQLSPNAIPSGARAGLLISRERFLEQMVLPGLPMAFPSSSAADFGMSPNGNAVINRAAVKTKPVTHAGSTYQPIVTALAISVVGDEIVVSSTTRTDIALDTYSEVTVTSFQRLKVANKPDGTQTLIYETSRPPIQDHVTKTTAQGEALKVVLEIAAIVVGAILTVLTEGAFLIVALIILALLIGLIEALPSLIADAVGNKVSNKSPSLALLVSNSTEPIRWPGGADFKLIWAGMNDSLQLGGNPGFA